MELVVAMTYGSALFEAARELDKLETIKNEVTQIDQILNDEPSFIGLLKNPSISVLDKKQMLRRVFEGKASDEVLSLLFILVDRGRISYYHQIVKEFLRLYDRHHGEAFGKVYSAVELTSDEIEKLENETSKLLKEKIRLENVIDTSLLGGVKIAVDGKIIDASLSSKLKDLKAAIYKF